MSECHSIYLNTPKSFHQNSSANKLNLPLSTEKNPGKFSPNSSFCFQNESTIMVFIIKVSIRVRPLSISETQKNQYEVVKVIKGNVT